MNEENVSHVRHLEPLHQLPFDALDHQDVISNEIINVISKDDDDAVLPVNVDECVGRERKLFKGDEERVDRLPPIPGVLSQSIQALPQLYEKLNAVLVSSESQAPLPRIRSQYPCKRKQFSRLAVPPPSPSLRRSLAPFELSKVGKQERRCCRSLFLGLGPSLQPPHAL